MASDPLVTSIQTQQYFFDIHSSERFQALCRILDMYTGASVFIFCRTKKDVDHISEKLTLLNYNVSSYHGDLSPTARERGLKKFIDKTSNVLLLTDIPAQLDGFPDIDLILFSIIPQDPDSYIQRIIRLESVIKIKEVATLIAPNEFKKIAFIKRVTKTDIHHKDFLSPDEIIEIKKKALMANIQSFDCSTLDSDIVSFANDLSRSMDPKDVLAYLLSHGYNGAFLKSSYRSFSQTTTTKKHAVAMSHSVNGDRLFIALGKADGIDDSMLIDFLHDETNIEKDRFGEIKIFETFSFFVVSAEEAEIILEIFRRKKRGKRSIVERAKGKDAVKKKP
jgi:ATP-dependent RNA helicase DeaD